MLNQQVPSRAIAVAYMQRTRQYYRALGYTQDYVWAKHQTTPLHLPTKPLSEMRLGILTTASPAGTTKQTLPSVWSASTSKKPASLYTDNLAWDKETTHTNDTETFLPLQAINTLVANGEVGELSPRYYGIPSEYSQRQTLKQDAPRLVDLVLEDRVDAMLLVPL